VSEAAVLRAESAVRLRATDRPPLGLLFAACGAFLAGVVALLRLDRLPFALCAFKQLTGLPCPTCGGTRALGRLATLDLPGAFAMNPLAVSVGVVVALWAVADLAMLPRRQSLRLEMRKDLAFAVRAAAVVLAAVNWAYLVLAGR